MQYLGGKSRVAKTLIALMEPCGGPFVDLCCGGLSVSVAAARAGFGPITCVDANAALICTYRAVQSGWVPPDTLSESEYARLKAANDPTDPLTAFAAIGCSFGGKWWGGYARQPGYNFAAGAKKRLASNIEILRAAEFVCADILTYAPSANRATVYADPPYAGTTGYLCRLDHARFWERMRKLAAVGHRVHVSEFRAPEDFREIWTKPMTQGKLAKPGAIDKLFTL